MLTSPAMPRQAVDAAAPTSCTGARQELHRRGAGGRGGGAGGAGGGGGAGARGSEVAAWAQRVASCPDIMRIMQPSERYAPLCYGAATQPRRPQVFTTSALACRRPSQVRPSRKAAGQATKEQHQRGVGVLQPGTGGGNTQRNVNGARLPNRTHDSGGRSAPPSVLSSREDAAAAGLAPVCSPSSHAQPLGAWPAARSARCACLPGRACRACRAHLDEASRHAHQRAGCQRQRQKRRRQHQGGALLQQVARGGTGR